MPVITIARQLGSGGEEIAALVARHLGARLFDDALLEAASERTGIPARYFRALDERGRSMMRRPADLVQLVPLPPINPDMPDVFGDRYPPTGPVRARGEGLQSPMYWASEAYAAAITRTIQLLAEDGNAVIVGRGGNEALAGAPGVLNVLVCASEPVRIRRVAQAEGVNLYDAEELVERSDRRRRAYVRQFFGVHWLDATRFDVVIRTDTVTLAQAARVVAEAARSLDAGQSMAASPAGGVAVAAG